MTDLSSPRLRAQAVASTVDFEVWGDGEQTRSFMYVDDCVEGILRIMMSDFDKPLNLGTEEMVSMNQFAEIAMSFEGKDIPIRHIPGPQGVRGRNSDNALIREKVGWEPSIPVREGLREVRSLIDGLYGHARTHASASVLWCCLSVRAAAPPRSPHTALPCTSTRHGTARQTYFWIKGQIEKERAAGVHNDYSSSKVVVQTTESLDVLGKTPNSIPESDTEAAVRMVA